MVESDLAWCGAMSNERLDRIDAALQKLTQSHEQLRVDLRKVADRVSTLIARLDAAGRR